MLQGIEMSRRPQGRHLNRAAGAFAYAQAELERTHPGLTRVTPAGDFRRGCELIGALVLIAVDPYMKGPNDIITAVDNLTIHVTSKQRYGITLLLATGSDRHIEALKAVAKHRKLTLDGEASRRTIA